MAPITYHLDALGMTSRSRAKPGLDVARGFGLAASWSEGQAGGS